MKAICFENRKILTREVPLPALRPGEALVRVSVAGICATDIAMFHGYAGFRGIPGHEFTGVVEKCPDNPDWEGKRVVADINIGCGACANEKHCPERRVLGIRAHDGAFAEYCAVPTGNLFFVPGTVKTRHAAVAELLAAALEISQQIHITARHRIAVLGDGCLGILCAMGLRHYAKKVVLAGRHREKLAIARAQGVETCLAGDATDPENPALQPGYFDITVDATGNKNGIADCIALTRPKGIVAAKTTATEKSEIDLAAVVVNELNIIGSRCGDMALALDFLENGRVDVEPLITAVYPFSRFNEAFFHAMEKESLKIIVDFD